MGWGVRVEVRFCFSCCFSNALHLRGPAHHEERGDQHELLLLRVCVCVRQRARRSVSTARITWHLCATSRVAAVATTCATRAHISPAGGQFRSWSPHIRLQIPCRRTLDISSPTRLSNVENLWRAAGCTLPSRPSASTCHQDNNPLFFSVEAASGWPDCAPGSSTAAAPAAEARQVTARGLSRLAGARGRNKGR